MTRLLGFVTQLVILFGAVVLGLLAISEGPAIIRLASLVGVVFCLVIFAEVEALTRGR